MKIIKGIIIIAILTIMCGCESNIEEVKINEIAPMDIEQYEDEIAEFLEENDTSVLFTSNFDDSFSKCRIIIEIYEDGNLIEMQNEIVLEVKNSLNLAIIEHDSGNWEIKTKSENDIVSWNVDAGDKIISDKDMFKVWKYLNHQVDVKINEPQIIGINYIDNSSSISHQVSSFENNKIENMYQYKYLKVIKVTFE